MSKAETAEGSISLRFYRSEQRIEDSKTDVREERASISCNLAKNDYIYIYNFKVSELFKNFGTKNKIYFILQN